MACRRLVREIVRQVPQCAPAQQALVCTAQQQCAPVQQTLVCAPQQQPQLTPVYAQRQVSLNIKK